MNNALSEKLPMVSTDTGVYLMKDEKGTVIYVGKALNLRKRLSSYFTQNSGKDVKTGMLKKKINSFDIIITATEKEAFILESNLIKKYRPRYNVILKDDKRYPSLRLDIQTPYPNITVVRKIKNDGSLYFGPFSSSHAVKETVKIIQKTFKLRKCKTKDVKNRNRPCLNYQMGACLAPCCLNVNEAEYRKIVNEVVLFLKGKTPDLIKKIKSEMIKTAENKAYEQAAELRDKMIALEKTLEKQVVVSTDFKDRDIIGVGSSDFFSAITMLTVRNGFLTGSRNFEFSEVVASDAELIESFIKQYYEKPRFIPHEILACLPVTSVVALEDVLYGLSGKKVHIGYPQRGEKKRLTDMAIQNARAALVEAEISHSARKTMLKNIQNRLHLKKIPERIECFDNSSISGSSPVAGLVVFKNGRPEKSSYRRYNIKNIRVPDDYAYMSEVLHRRFSDKKKLQPFPDLLIVDGGKGQLNIALDVLKDLNINDTFDVVAIAKKDAQKGEATDKVYQPNRSNPVHFGKDRELLLFLQRIRDEAHRFAISFHRKKRTKASLHSEMDSIQGIGKKRKATLLKHFGSIKKIRTASIEELRMLPGMNIKAAESVSSALKR